MSDGRVDGDFDAVNDILEVRAGGVADASSAFVNIDDVIANTRHNTQSARIITLTHDPHKSVRDGKPSMPDCVHSNNRSGKTASAYVGVYGHDVLTRNTLTLLLLL